MGTVEGKVDELPAYRRPAEEVAAALGSDIQRGLSGDEARDRREHSGPNELRSEEPTPAWRKFLAQFQGTLVILLLIATAISFGLWVYERDEPLPIEALVIFAIVLLNGILGYVQEARAEQALAALRAMSAARATVVRDGERRSILATELVPGDLLLLEEGDTVPADGRLVRSTALRVSEASLTGESLPVEKDAAPLDEEADLGDRRNSVFSGTVVAYGRGAAVVTATGMDTEMGKIAGLLHQTSQERTPLQAELDRTGRLLGIVVLVIAAIIVGTIIVVEQVRSFSALVDVLILGVALAVAAVPEGLPAVVTAVLALGVQRMARRNAIVRHLPAVETLGSATVIASDKTGTLTRNEMTVRIVATASGRAEFSGTGYEPTGEVRRIDRLGDGRGSTQENGGTDSRHETRGESRADGPSDAQRDDRAAGRNAEQDGDRSLSDGPLCRELERALVAADLANNAALHEQDGRWSIQGDPTEGALIVAARKLGLDTDKLVADEERIGEVPFSSERKMMTTLHREQGDPARIVAYAKGAPDVLLARCTHERVGEETRPLTDERRDEIRRVNEELAEQALRTLGVACRSLPATASERDGEAIEREMVFLGLIGMIDPPREEVKVAVGRAHTAGIRPIMITGDHPITARAIARELRIGDDERAVVGSELERLDGPALDDTVRASSVYARVNPDHKLRIVEALQRTGGTVAMTGDGVNDAPALRTADIGVAMGITGTDVSKEAADMVLADDNFATIVAAVEEGRAIFANIQSFLRYLLSSNSGEVLTMFFGVILAGVLGLTGETVAEGSATVVLPLLATQILWINLVTDGPPALALGVDPADPDVMAQRPRPRGSAIITARMWRGIVLVGLVMAIGTLFVLDASLPGGLVPGGGTLAYGRTMAFTTLVLFQLFNVLNARSDERSAFVGLLRNRWLWGALGLSLVLHVLVIYVPFLQQGFDTVALGPGDWLLCSVVASSVLWLRELSKLARW